jgi:hypothetical protein
MLRVALSRSVLFRVVVVLLGTTLALLGFELVARVIWTQKYLLHLEKQLHGFDHVDRERGIIVPDAGIERSLREMRADFEREGKTLGLSRLDELESETGLSPDDPVFAINRHGFKGPEFEIPRPEGVFRILAVGDSCTWGPEIDALCYPRVLEAELRRRRRAAGDHRTIEVVNAGVMGYNLESVLRRIDDLVATEPDLATIYLGWNRTIGRADPRRSPELYARSALYRLFYHAFFSGALVRVTSGELPVHDPADPLMEELRHHDFSWDLHRLDEIVTAFQREDPRCRVVLLTLPGLLDERAVPTPEALAKAYPVEFTSNLFAWAVLTRGWNEALLGHGRDRGLPVLDLEAWALRELDPRDRFFGDSVHPLPEAHRLLGRYLAARIEEEGFLDGFPQSSPAAGRSDR